MKDEVVPRDSKPTQVGGWVFVAVCFVEFESLSLLSLSAFAACSAIERFPELPVPFTKESDRRPLNASPLEGDGSIGLLDLRFV